MLFIVMDGYGEGLRTSHPQTVKNAIVKRMNRNFGVRVVEDIQEQMHIEETRRGICGYAKIAGRVLLAGKKQSHKRIGRRDGGCFKKISLT